MRNLQAKKVDGGRITPLPTAIWAAVAVVALWATPTAAGDSPWGGALGFGSDNVYRGLSLTAGRPAWLADVHRTVGPDWVVGLSASAERPAAQDAGTELALYAQRGWQVSQDWALQLGAMHHEFPSNNYRDQLRYDEVSLGLTWQGRLRALLTVSPNTAGYYPQRYTERGNAAWLELSVEQPLHGRLSANVGIGRALYSQANLPDYHYASAGLRYNAGSTYWYVSYVWSDLEGYFYRHTSITGSRWVWSVVWTFP